MVANPLQTSPRHRADTVGGVKRDGENSGMRDAGIERPETRRAAAGKNRRQLVQAEKTDAYRAEDSSHSRAK